MTTLTLITTDLKDNKIVVKDRFNLSNDGIVNLGYGFNPTYYDVEAKEPGMPNEKYKLHKVVRPYEGDTIIHEKSGRVFTVGEVTGFLHFEAPLFENDKQVATLKFESYYKD